MMNFTAQYDTRGMAFRGSNSVGAPDAGVRTFRAELYSEFRQVLVDIPSPEQRLFDHLNSSAPTIDVRLLYLARDNWASVPDLISTPARVTKARILMAVPIEDADPSGDAAEPFGDHNAEHLFRVGIGPYDLSATMPAEPGRDPLLALSQNPRQFVPLRRVTVNFVDGRSISYAGVLVNRSHIDVLTVER